MPWRAFDGTVTGLLAEWLGLTVEDVLLLAVALLSLGAFALLVSEALRPRPGPAPAHPRGEADEERGVGERPARKERKEKESSGAPLLAAVPPGLARRLDAGLAAELWRLVKRGVEEGRVMVKLAAPGCDGYVVVDLSGEFLCVTRDGRAVPLDSPHGASAVTVYEDEEESGG